MTPAEQGQAERYETTVHDKRTGAPVAGCDGNALAELEMCQRYFPFMRRSRDEAVRKLSACQEELARLKGEWLRRGEQWDKWRSRAVAAETARDEAVKREKALVAALENALAADTESETRHILYAALDQSGKGARR